MASSIPILTSILGPPSSSTTAVTSAGPPSTSIPSVISLSTTRSVTTSSNSTSSDLSSTTDDSAPPPPPSPNPLTSLRLTTSGNNVITITSVVPAFPTHLAPSASNTAAPKAFFKNTAAIAGVFSVIGIIGVVLIFVLVTNAIRKRRAKQFDREVAEAAAAAAAAEPPVFDDEDDTYGGGGSKFTQYSENSHGTYGQPPMTNAGTGESYGMSEVMYPYDPFGSTLGAGTAGVGVGSRKDIRADIIGASSMTGYDVGGVMPGYGEHASPYPAFVPPQAMYNSAPAPSLPTQVPGGTGPCYPGPGNVNDLMEAAGLSITRGPSQRLPNTGYGAIGIGQDPVQGESYAARYQPGYQHDSPPPKSEPVELTDNDAYGGAQVESPLISRKTDSPHSRHSSEHSDSDARGENLHVVDSRASFADEFDYELERGKRVLKVTNA